MLKSLYPLESSIGLGAHRERPSPRSSLQSCTELDGVATPAVHHRPADFSDESAVLLWSTFLTKALPEVTDCELSSAQQESASVKASAVPDSKGLGDAGRGVAEGTGPFGWDPGSPHEACQAPASGSLTGKRACSPPTVYTWAAPSLIM